METVKKGSKGEAVRVLQKALGLVNDGVFGQNTYNALVAYQKKMGLWADGVCGKQTWDKLGITGDVRCVDESVKYMPLSVHITNYPNRPITYLAIHFTAGSRSNHTAQNVFNVFNSRKASADFCVDDDQILQFNPDLRNNYCWAVGDTATKAEGGASLSGKAGNRNTISIEVCSSIKSGYSVNYSNHDGWYFTEAALENARKLTRILMKKYNIPLDRVVRHYDISGKLCPGIVGWNDGYIYSNQGKRTGGRNNSAAWEAFKKSL